jgi:hypothetical protein
MFKFKTLYQDRAWEVEGNSDGPWNFSSFDAMRLVDDKILAAK